MVENLNIVCVDYACTYGVRLVVLWIDCCDFKLLGAQVMLYGQGGIGTQCECALEFLGFRLCGCLTSGIARIGRCG